MKILVWGWKHEHLKLQYSALLRNYNLLVDAIKEMTSKKSTETNLHFTQEELKKLITLCHPDKHGGSKIAEEMTAKLLEMRSRVKKREATKEREDV